jgi:hypothetical protein
VTRVFGQSSGGERALWSVGAGSCAVALVVFVLAWISPAGAADTRSLFMAGTALLAGGVGACVLGWRPRRQWVKLDDVWLSRPWAPGSANLELRQLSAIQASKSGGVLVSSTSGAQLRIDGELPGFGQLLQLLCDLIADNGYPTTATTWREGQRRAAINAREVSFRQSDQGPPTRLAWREITGLGVAHDERRRLVPALELVDGQRLSLPYLGRLETLELYRALRQQLRRPSSLTAAAAPLPAAARRPRPGP